MTEEIKALLKEYWDRGYKYIFQTCDDDIFITKLSFTDSASTEFLFSKHSKEAIYCPLTTFRELFDETPFRRIRIAELIGEVDWYSVKKDTRVIIDYKDGSEVLYRYFSYTTGDYIYVYSHGADSWSSNGVTNAHKTSVVRLAENVK